MQETDENETCDECHLMSEHAEGCSQSAPWAPPPDAIQWDCTKCDAGFWLTALEAAKGCPADHPELCGSKLSKREGGGS